MVRSGGAIVQQTYLWNPSTGQSVPMRSKEDAHDYRYFPDPDLVPLIVEKEWVEKQRALVPELPANKRSRFEKQYGLSTYASAVLTSTPAISGYFEKTVQYSDDPIPSGNWIMGDILRIVNDSKIDINKLSITPERLAAIQKFVAEGKISAQTAKKVIDLVQAENKEPRAVIAEKGFVQISDSNTLEAAVKQVIESNPEAVLRYKAGEKKLTGFFVGQAVKATGGKGNPKEISAIVIKLLG